MKLLFSFLFSGLLVNHLAAQTGIRVSQKENPITSSFTTWASKPPMGWNSYDAYHGAVTEKQFLESIEVVRKKLLPLGYKYVTIDFCWFNPGPPEWDPVNNWKTIGLQQQQDANGNFSPQLAMDKFGRLLPAENRFPSAKNNIGFKAIGDEVHRKGMKFGIHIMRGIPRQAVAVNTPIAGTKYFAKDIAETFDTCKWNNNMYGVDASKPGAQEYYNSLFKLYASWGVDFVKVDDISSPTYHAAEIKLIRNAIDACGRKMLLSLSCGESFVSYAHHMEANANLYRVSIDFWDEWKDVLHMFDVMYMWQPFIGNGTWPDADMLPIGKLCLTGFPVRQQPPNFDPNTYNKREHFSFLTREEQKTMMSLWCMVRSPLIWGGDPLQSTEEDYAMISNKELLYINQNSSNNHQVDNFTYSGMAKNNRIWIADETGTKNKYVALFNISDKEQDIRFELEWEEIRGKFQVRDIWKHADEEIITKDVLRKVPPHGAIVLKLTSIK
jgi:alpha-galactosidase